MSFRDYPENTRLFILTGKGVTEDTLREKFEQYGKIEDLWIVKDKRTHEDKAFKPKFAEPKKVQETPDRYDRDSYSRRDDRSDRSDRSDRYNDRYDDRYERRGPPGGYPYDRDDRDRDHRGGSVSGGSMDLLPDFPHANCQRLHVTTTMGLTQPYLHKLFNIVPGLEYCDLNEQTGVAYVRYETPQQAAYAREKLDQFEYPIGSRLSVRFADNMGRQSSMDNYMASPGSYRGGGGRMDLMGDNSVQQVHQAARVLEQAGINPDLVLQPNVLGQGSVGGHALSANNITSPRDDINERVTYCNAKLPLVKSLLPEDTPTDQRLFIVCQPAAVPERILRDAFSRFGNLIEVLEAEPMKKDEDEAHKRQRTEVPIDKTADIQCRDSETWTTNVNWSETWTTNVNWSETWTTNVKQSETWTTNVNWSETWTTNVKQSGTCTTNVNWSETLTTNVNWSETWTTNVNQSETWTTNVKQSETLTTNVNWSETWTTNVKQSETLTTNVNWSETWTTNVKQSETWTTNVNWSETWTTNVKQSETWTTNVKQSETWTTNVNWKYCGKIIKYLKAFVRPKEKLYEQIRRHDKTAYNLFSFTWLTE
ncbi:RBM45-like protein [Mya arenaria]|uniref:RBM45-like protein n=1 Tax=Mya arenaria TaxID=6604 RepID=A0ABY7DAT0_MYAAR|nr:RBM45-like protein [Mya arenaria]